MPESPAPTLPPAATAIPRPVVALLAAVSSAVLLLWVFPSFWYTQSRIDSGFTWFGEQTVVAGWTYTNLPLSGSAEALLAADRIVNGEFVGRGGERIRAYSAKRYLTKENEIGLFSHTPDRCWTAVGWKLEPADPDYVERRVHGVPLLLERRVFVQGNLRELVYFGALVGGKPLPYRIDQYLGAGRKRQDAAGGDVGGTWQRLKELRLWSWALESFLNRTPLAGPQQFLRLSTPVSREQVQAADDRLTAFLAQWLAPVDYSAELQTWKPSAK
jgi:hypothetical protein